MLKQLFYDYRVENIMTSKLRRMKPYHPRKRKTKAQLNKQVLHDLQHKISSNVGSLLVLMKEGKADLAQEAQHRAKTDFIKLAPQMQHTAQLLGERCSLIVGKYLDVINQLIHSNPLSLDPAMINDCYKVTEQLEQELRAA